VPRTNNRPALVSRSSASRSCGSGRSVVDARRTCPNSRPIAAPVCATSLAAGPSRSSRAIREACKVGGTENAGCGAEDSAAGACCDRASAAFPRDQRQCGRPALREDNCGLEAVASPAPKGNPEMSDQIIGAVVARGRHADACRVHPMVRHKRATRLSRGSPLATRANRISTSRGKPAGRLSHTRRQRRS
jgi:hypothetical protein